MPMKFNPLTGELDIVRDAPTVTTGGTGQTSYTKGDVLYSDAANSLAKLPIGTQEQVLGVSSAGVPYWRNLLDPRRQSTLFDDFLFLPTAGVIAAGDTWWVTSVSGAGSAVSQTAGTTTNPGILTLGTGTTTGTATVKKSFTSFMLGGGAFTMDILARVPVLSTAADEFWWAAGLMDGASVTPNNCVRALYNRARTYSFTGTVTNGANTITGITSISGVMDINSLQVGQPISGTNIPAGTTIASVNYGAATATMSANATPGSGAVTITALFGNYWVLQVAKAATFTYLITNQAVTAGAWVHLEAVINAAATSIAVTANGVAQSAITTNIPNTVAVGPTIAIAKTAVTAASASTVDVDYWYHNLILSAQR